MRPYAGTTMTWQHVDAGRRGRVGTPTRLNVRIHEVDGRAGAAGAASPVSLWPPSSASTRAEQPRQVGPYVTGPLVQENRRDLVARIKRRGDQWVLEILPKPVHQ